MFSCHIPPLPYNKQINNTTWWQSLSNKTKVPELLKVKGRQHFVQALHATCLHLLICQNTRRAKQIWKCGLLVSARAQMKMLQSKQQGLLQHMSISLNAICRAHLYLTMHTLQHAIHKRWNWSLTKQNKKTLSKFRNFPFSFEQGMGFYWKISHDLILKNYFNTDLLTTMLCINKWIPRIQSQLKHSAERERGEGELTIQWPHLHSFSRHPSGQKAAPCFAVISLFCRSRRRHGSCALSSSLRLSPAPPSSVFNRLVGGCNHRNVWTGNLTHRATVNTTTSLTKLFWGLVVTITVIHKGLLVTNWTWQQEEKPG